LFSANIFYIIVDKRIRR